MNDGILTSQVDIEMAGGVFGKAFKTKLRFWSAGIIVVRSSRTTIGTAPDYARRCIHNVYYMPKSVTSFVNGLGTRRAGKNRWINTLFRFITRTVST